MSTFEQQPQAPLVALQAASQALARVRVDEDDILEALRQQVQALLPPSRVHILLFADDEARLYAWEPHGERLPPAYFETPAGRGIVGWMRATRESLLVGDFRRDWEALPARPGYHHPDPPRAAIFVPLVVGDEVLGTLSAQSREPDVYTPDHLWQLKILANQTAAALQAGRLLRAEQARSAQLQTLAEVTRSVVSILDLDVLLGHVVEVIQKAFGYYHVQVYVIEEGTDRAVFRASSSPETRTAWLQKRRHVHIGKEGMIGWVAAHGETLVAPDVSIDPLYIPDDPRLLPNTRSEAAIPLRLENRVLGVLDVQSDRLNAFGPDDLMVLHALADAVALAVANARLYARVQEDAWITVALLQVAEAIGHLTELGDVVTTVARLVPLLAGARTVALWLEDPRAERGTDPAVIPTFRPVAQWGVAPELSPLFFKHALTAADSPALTRLVAVRAPIVLRQVQVDEQLAPIPAQALAADAVVLLPLLAHGDLMGVMAVALNDENDPPIERRLPLLKGIADQAAAAIAGARLIAAQREEAWVNTALLQVAEAIGRAANLAETLELVARLTTTLTGLDRCTLWLRRPGAEDYELAMSYGRRPLPPLEAGLTWHLSQVPLLERLRQERRPLVCDGPEREALLPVAVAANLAAGAVIAVPLLARADLAGMMLVEAIENPAALSPRLFDILIGIAHQAGVAIERAWLQEAELARQRLETELALARAIQRGFLPETVPTVPGYEIAAVWEPARQIGGDFYDVIPLPDGRLGLVVGDVADKGIPAALYMALARTTMRLVAARNPSPAAALQRVNTAILDTTYSDLFVTIYYAILDPATHEVVYASAGHGLAVHVTAGNVRFVRGRGSALGVLPTIAIAEERLQLAPGDYLVLYTDGLTDAVNPALEDFGEARLIAFLEAHRGLAATALADHLLAAVHAWCDEAPRFDDYTVLVVRRVAAAEVGW